MNPSSPAENKQWLIWDSPQPGYGSIFTPSIYAAFKLATTTIQAEAIATGAKKIQLDNLGTVAIYIGLGMTEIDAKAAAVSGKSGLQRFLITPEFPAIIAVNGYTHCAWYAQSGSQSFKAAQGV